MNRWIAGSFAFVAAVSSVKASDRKFSTPNIEVKHNRTSSKVDSATWNPFLLEIGSPDTNPFLDNSSNTTKNLALSEKEIKEIQKHNSSAQQEGDARRRILQYESKNPTATPSSQAPNRLSPSHEPTPEGKKGTTRKVQFILPE